MALREVHAPIAGLRGLDAVQLAAIQNVSLPSRDPLAEGPPIKFKGGRVVALSAQGERVIAAGRKKTNGKKRKSSRKPARRS